MQQINFYAWSKLWQKKSGNTSYETRQLVICHHKEGKMVKEIMSLFQKSRSTVYRIIKANVSRAVNYLQ